MNLATSECGQERSAECDVACADSPGEDACVAPVGVVADPDAPGERRCEDERRTDAGTDDAEV